ncbi:MAG: hypothetical protein ACYTG6_04260 [Planctomycetota bacterium]|jgi:mono/diheme cytochrome c family protein
MRTSIAASLCFLALFLAACGDCESDGGTATGAAPALEGNSWIGGDAMDPSSASENVRVIAFFKPG